LRFSLLLLSIGVLSGLIYGGYLFYKISLAADNSFQDFGRDKSDLRIDDVKIGKDPITILMVGVESYKDVYPRHSDTIILYTINPETKEVLSLSIPRDTRTYIPIIDRKDKLANSYAYGKDGEEVKATIESVEQLLNVPVDYYITTNFQGLEGVVDELGGIDVKVPFDFKQGTPGGKLHYFKEGKMHLNGQEALAFARMRKQDPRGDFGRQERQQQVITSIADEALSIKTFATADNIIETAGENIQTNVSLKEMFAFRNFYKLIKEKPITTLTIKGEDQTIDNVYYYVPFEDSIEEISNELNRVLEIPSKNEDENNFENEDYNQ
jgi:polyisoprenyl-teichoic acid--peptidoglycan teichoic acid transferase